MEAPFLTQYRVYYLPTYAENVPHLPTSEVKEDWIVENLNNNASRTYSTKKKAVSKAKEFAKSNKPSEIYIHRKKDNSLQDKHEYHGEHFYGDKPSDIKENIRSRRGGRF